MSSHSDRRTQYDNWLVPTVVLESLLRGKHSTCLVYLWRRYLAKEVGAALCRPNHLCVGFNNDQRFFKVTKLLVFPKAYCEFEHGDILDFAVISYENSLSYAFYASN